MFGENNFNNKVVIVTGAAQGMGKAVSKRFAEYGAKIIINDINSDNLKSTETEFLKSGFNVIALELISVAVTLEPLRAREMATIPVPVPISSTVPGRGGSDRVSSQLSSAGL